MDKSSGRGLFLSNKEEYLFEEWLYYAAKKKYTKKHEEVAYFYMWSLRSPDEAAEKKFHGAAIAVQLLGRFREQPNYSQIMADPIPFPKVIRVCA